MPFVIPGSVVDKRQTDKSAWHVPGFYAAEAWVALFDEQRGNASIFCFCLPLWYFIFIIHRLKNVHCKRKTRYTLCPAPCTTRAALSLIVTRFINKNDCIAVIDRNVPPGRRSNSSYSSETRSCMWRCRHDEQALMLAVNNLVSIFLWRIKKI